MVQYQGAFQQGHRRPFRELKAPLLTGGIRRLHPRSRQPQEESSLRRDDLRREMNKARTDAQVRVKNAPVRVNDAQGRVKNAQVRVTDAPVRVMG